MYERRFDVCDGGKVAAAYLEDHATPAVPHRGKSAEAAAQAAGEQQAAEHADKVYILAAQLSDSRCCWHLHILNGRLHHHNCPLAEGAPGAMHASEVSFMVQKAKR